MQENELSCYKSYKFSCIMYFLELEDIHFFVD